ncbi:transposase [Halomarina salina]|uniref:Transposase n=1 Tax=Halomarina salina TaxID=1872699 RepID=A0ABD5RVB8_9EURY
MVELGNHSMEELRTALSNTNDAKAVKRLMIALAIKDDVSVTRLSTRYGIPPSTIYYWVNRFKQGTIEQALTDASRPGRPSKLTEEQRNRVSKWISNPPTQYGLEDTSWTPDALCKMIRLEFQVEYSVGHCKRILRNEAE